MKHHKAKDHYRKKRYNLIRRKINWWGPFRGAGIRVREISDDMRFARVELRPTWANMPSHGAHFGGSLFAMTDPLFPLMLGGVLGGGYTIWSKTGTIRFLQPGKGVVSAEFRITDAMLEDLKLEIEAKGKAEPTWVVSITNGRGETVAEAMHTLYVRPK